MPFSAVGNTGGAINQATGQGTVFDEALRRLFADESGAKVARDRGAANASNASAGRSAAEADLVDARLRHFMETGRMPGTEGSGDDATNAKTRNAIIAAVERELGAYATDEEIRAEVERRMARRDFATPPRAGAQPTTPAAAVPGALDAVAVDSAIANARAAIQRGADPAAVRQRLAQAGIDPARLDQPSAPAAAAAGPVVEAPRNPTDRVKGAVYRTPMGNMKWTGTGWIPAQ